MTENSTRKKFQAIRGGGKLPDLNQFFETAYDEMKNPRPEVPMSVDSLATDGAIVTLPSSRKTGKTTFLANLGVAGLADIPFLGKFDTHLDEDKTLVVVNAEMNGDDYRDIWRELDPREGPNGDYPYQRLYLMHCREVGVRLNLLDDNVAQQFVYYLDDVCASWLFLDPWKNIMAWAGAGINDNDMVNQMSIRLDETEIEFSLLTSELRVGTRNSQEVRSDAAESRILRLLRESEHGLSAAELYEGTNRTEASKAKNSLSDKGEIVVIRREGRKEFWGVEGERY